MKNSILLFFASAISLLLCFVACQKTPTAELSVSQNEYTVQASGGSVNVSVSSNVDLTVRISAGWITQAGGPSSGGGTYSFTVAHNDGYDARTATNTFSNGEQGESETVTSTQSQQDAIIPGSLEYQLFYEAQTFSLPVSANVDCSVSVSGGDWIKSLGTRGLTTKQYQFSIAENTGKTPREAVVTITSGSLKQSIKVEQLPTTHFPETEEDWNRSVELSKKITTEKTAIMKKMKNDGVTDINRIVESLQTINGVISAVPNEDGSSVTLLQRDSTRYVVFLNNPIIYSDYDPAKFIRDYLDKSKKSSSSSVRTDTRSSIVKKGGNALILSPFQSSLSYIADYWESELSNYFDCVKYWPDSDADATKFLGGYLSDFDFIIICTHGNTAYDYGKEVNVLATGSVYSTENIAALKKKGYNEGSFHGTTPEGDTEYILMDPYYLENASFDKTAVILAACYSSKTGTMIDKFRKKGASIVSGGKIEMNNLAWDHYILNMISCLNGGLSFKEAHDYSTNSEMSQQWVNSIKSSLLAAGITDAEGDDVTQYLECLPKSPKDDYYFFDPHPALHVSDTGRDFEWDSDLHDFETYNVSYTFSQKNGIITKNPVNLRTYDIGIQYHLYTDGKYKGKTTNKSIFLSDLTSGKHKAYVNAILAYGQGNKEIATYKSNEEKFEVKGEVVPVTGIRLTPSTITLEEGQSSQLTATVYPANATNKKVIWSSNYPESVSVDENGLITAIKRRLGVTIIITAKTEDGEKTATCRVYVNESTSGKVAVTGISLGQSSAEIKVGDVLQLNATVAPSNATNKTVTWSSSNNSVATVSSSGLVSGKAEGTAKITAKTEDGGKTATVTITVKKADSGSVSVTGVSLDKSSVSLKVGESETLKATVSPSNATNKGLTWTSSMSSVATITSDGVVTAKAAGTATITVKTDDGGKTATCNVTVTYNGDPGGEISVSQVTISPTTANMTVGDTKQFSVKIDPANATNQEVSWSSSEPSIASVDTKGMVTAKAEGKATITVTAKDGGVSSKATVTVSNKVVPVTGVTVSPTSLTMEIGDSKSLTVTVNPSDATDKTYTVTSDNTGVVEIDKNNNVVAKGAGTANVTVTTTDGAQTATCKVTVNKPQMTIEASPTSLSFGEVNVGESSTKTFTISNTGKAEVKISAISVPTAFSVDTSTPFTIAVGKSQTINVTFTPTDGKDYSGTVTITSDADSQPTVSVSGKGVKQSSSETFEAVDLGLSVKWANMNLGATKPEEYGDFYAWGEIKTKDNYSSKNYKWGDGDLDHLTKYNTNSKYGTVDNKKVLDPGDDIAYVTLGDKWRMPTDEEFLELRVKCEWSETTQNGIKGFLIVSDINGNSIFLPAGGRMDLTYHDYVGRCYYWTSTLYTNSPDLAYCRELDGRGFNYRRFGYSIRPVYGTPAISVESVSLDKTELELSVGETASLVAIITPSNATYPSVSWSSADESVATVSPTGVVKGISVGTVYIEVLAAYGGKRSSCKVTVK